MEAIQMEMAAAGQELLAGTMTEKLTSLRTLMTTEFTHRTLADANEAFYAEVAAKCKEPSPVETGVNATLAKLTNIVRDELATLVDALRQLEVWVSLLIPGVADGNNFGVEVQEMVVKMIKEKKDGVKTLLDGLNKYSSERGDLWGKSVFPVSVKKSQSVGSKKCTGGEKDTNETTESEDTATSYPMVCSDAVVAIAGHDTQHYFHLRSTLQEVWKTYAIVYDQITKNLEKIQDPRGEAGGGGGGMSMF